MEVILCGNQLRLSKALPCILYACCQIQPLIDARGAFNAQEREKDYSLTLDTLDPPTVAARAGICDLTCCGDR